MTKPTQTTFPGFEGLDQIPAMRSSDPITSFEAVEEIDREGIRERQAFQVLVRAVCVPGLTSAELAGDGLDRWQIARRLPELEHLGYVYKGDPRQCRVGRRRAVTWWPTARAMKAEITGHFGDGTRI